MNRSETKVIISNDDTIQTVQTVQLQNKGITSNKQAAVFQYCALVSKTSSQTKDNMQTEYKNSASPIMRPTGQVLKSAIIFRRGRNSFDAVPRHRAMSGSWHATHSLGNSRV